MSFYGSISDRSRTDLKFDKIYPSRFIMDSNVNTDEIFVGRYVLVNYEDGYKDVFYDQYAGYYCIEKDPGTYSFWSKYLITEDSGGDIEKAPGGVTLTRSLETENLSIAFKIDKDKHLYDFNTEPIYLRLKLLDSEDHYELAMGQQITESAYKDFWERDSIGQLRYLAFSEPASLVKENDILVSPIEEEWKNFCDRIYQCYVLEETMLRKNNELGDDEFIDKPFCVKIYPYHSYKTNAKEEVWVWTKDRVPLYVGNYDELEYINFDIDKIVYNNKRGYDSTVWEKIYINDEYRYIKIAELNTYVPNFDLYVNPPTAVPKTPQISTVSDNINYRIDWQPSWGFRVKSANTMLAGKKISHDGVSQDENAFVSTGADPDFWTDVYGNIKSDVNTQWTTEFFNDESKSYNKYNFVVSADSPNYGEWKEQSQIDSSIETKDIPAAIYFNKAGFDVNHTRYSNNSYIYPGFTVHNYDQKNFIKVEPTGLSGKIYHDNGNETAYPDTQELSIMLPALGDTIAHMWDLIYGAGESRKLDISWKEATYVEPIRQGNRLVSYTNPYNLSEVNTLSGCINTAHDLIGMIVAGSDKDVRKPDLNLDDYSEFFIYYNSPDGKFYQKQKYTKLVPKTNDNLDDVMDGLFTPVPVQTTDENGNKIENIVLFDDIVQNNVSGESSTTKPKYYFLEKTGETAVNKRYQYILSDSFQSDRQYVKINKVTVINPIELGMKRFVENTFYIPLGQDFGLAKEFDYSQTYYALQFEKISKTNPLSEYQYDGVYVPGLYFYEMPIYDGNKKIGSTYIQDTTPSGYVYDYLPGGSNATPQDYMDNYYHKKALHYLPIIHDDTALVEVENFVPLAENYDKDKHKHLYDLLYIQDEYGVYRHVNPNDYASGVEYYVRQMAVEDSPLVTVDTSRTYKLKPYVEGQIFYLDMENPTLYYHCDMQTVRDIVYKKKVIKDFYYLVSGNENPITLYSADNLPPYYDRVTKEDSDFPGSYILNREPNIEEFERFYEINEEDLTFVNMFSPYDYYEKVETEVVTGQETYSDEETGELITRDVVETKVEFVPLRNPDALPDIIYKKNDLRVCSDTKGRYITGARWNALIAPPEGVTLGYAEESYRMVPLVGFARNLNTMLGLIVKINNLINEQDFNSRDRKTIQGTLNCLNDIINFIDELYPNELVFTDQFGRIHAPKNSYASDNYIDARIQGEQFKITHKDANQPEGYFDGDYDPVTLLNQTETLEEDEDGDGVFTTHETNYIAFDVPVIFADQKGHIFEIKHQTYKIPCASLAQAALEKLDARVTALEEEALRVYEQGVSYEEEESDE